MQRMAMLMMAGMTMAAGALAQPVILSDPAVRLEDLLEDREEDAEQFDFNTLFEGFLQSRLRPLDLNAASEAVLRESGLFNEVQIFHLLSYRDMAGPLIAVYELQAIPGFELDEIRALLPFVSVGGAFDDLQVSLKDMVLKGRNDLFLRWRRQLEAVKGSDTFEGDPNQAYLRYRHAYENRFSYGFTGEKDPGEAFGRGSNPQGFDFLSAHLFLRNYNRHIRAVAIGDYSAAFGQGLILNNGFGYGKSPSTMDIKRGGGRSLSPFTSVNESSFFRGAGATLSAGKNLETTFFISKRRRDANIDAENPGQRVTSLLLAGAHRTADEIADEKSLGQLTAGGNLKWQLKRGHLAANAVYDRLDKELFRSPQPYNQFQFSGDQLFNASLDYAWRLRGLHFFGETGWSANGALAAVSGLVAGLDPKADLSLLLRHYPRHFQTLHGTPFAETAGANESGFYLGLEVRPFRMLKINGYFDIWKHPWLRFQTDEPSGGYEWLLRFTFFRKRQWEAIWQLRGERKERNDPFHHGKTNALGYRDLLFSRLHINLKLSKSLEWRTRIEMGRFSNEGSPSVQTGMLFYQDLLFKPLGFPLSFTTRFGLFDTDSYEVRFYAYENGLLYNFSIPAYSDRGKRFYLNIRYKGIRNLTLEARYAAWFYPGNQEIGSGINATPGQRRSEVGVLLNWSFGQ